MIVNVYVPGANPDTLLVISPGPVDQLYEYGSTPPEGVTVIAPLLVVPEQPVVISGVEKNAPPVAPIVTVSINACRKQDASVTVTVYVPGGTPVIDVPY